MKFRQAGLRVRTCMAAVMVVLGIVFGPVSGINAQEEKFENVELDQFIIDAKNASLAAQKRRLITMAKPVAFEARMKRLPEVRKMSYIYVAMEMAGVSPLPEVGHRMFVESDQGRIIPVYVEKQVAVKLESGLKEEDQAQFLGYHVYSYVKGPAILVVDFYPMAR